MGFRITNNEVTTKTNNVCVNEYIYEWMDVHTYACMYVCTYVSVFA